MYICNNIIKKIRGYELEKKLEGHQVSWKEEVGAMWIQYSDKKFSKKKLIKYLAKPLSSKSCNNVDEWILDGLW